MINYIKMDLFRLFKSVSFYVCSLVLLIMISATISEVRVIEREGKEQGMEEAVNNADTKETGFFTASYEGEEKEEIVLGGVSVAPLIVAEKGTLSSCMNSLYSGNVIQFVVLLIISIFICNEFASGYIKNTIMIPKHRWIFNISKLVTAFVVILVENIIAILSFVFAIRFIFKNMVIGDIKQLMGYLALETILLLGMSALVLLVCHFVRSRVVGIIFALLMGLQVVAVPIIGVFCMVLEYKFEKVCKFLLTLTANTIAPGLGHQAVMEVLALGIGTLVVYTLFSNLVLSNKDI